MENYQDTHYEMYENPECDNSHIFPGYQEYQEPQCIEYQYSEPCEHLHIEYQYMEPDYIDPNDDLFKEAREAYFNELARSMGEGEFTW